MLYKEFILSLLQKSSAIAKSYFGKATSSLKAGDKNQVLTEADLKIGKTAVREISNRFPEHNIIDEESGVINNKSGLTWVIDPIDGTGNFAAGLPFYGTIIGLLKGEKPIAGGVVLPFFDELYIAEDGSGAYCNSTRIRVTDKTDLFTTLVAYGIDSHLDNRDITRKEMKLFADLVNSVQNVRITNSCYDAMMVACGKFGGYLNQSMRIWDIVGLQPIIEEAGGVVTDLNGKKIDYSEPLKKYKDHFTFLSSAAGLHGELLKIIKRDC